MIIEGSSSFSFHEPAGFIAVDGVNGAGKSTLIARIVEELTARGLPLETTREPGGTELGVKLRRLLLESTGTAPLAELFLFAADRAQHVAARIRPALEAGRLVITDRFYYSTEAFQGYGRGLPLGAVQEINRLAVDGCLPDLLILLDLDPEKGLQRAGKRPASGEQDSFEKEELAFHVRLRNGFLELARHCAEPCLIVDASRDEAAVWSRVRPLIQKWSDAWVQHRRT